MLNIQAGCFNIPSNKFKRVALPKKKGRGKRMFYGLYLTRYNEAKKSI